MKTTATFPIETVRAHLLPNAELPVAVELERVVLGQIMIETGGDIDQSMLLLTGDSFYDGRHRTIFDAMTSIERQGGKIDLYTVANKLKTDNNLASIGGAAYLTELTQLVGSGAHFEAHVRHLLQCQIGRQLASVSYRAMCRVLDGVDVAEVMDGLQDALDAASTVGLADNHQCHVSIVTGQVVEQIQLRAQKAAQGVVAGVTTGLKALDALTGGWQAGQLIILAARPGMGKTAFMLHLALSAAKARVPVMIYSVEMSSQSITQRLILSQCQVSADSVKSGRVSTSEFAELSAAKARLDAMPIYIDDKSCISMRYIATNSKIAHRKGKCGLILIDYLQLLDMRTAEKGRSREQEVAQASKAAKELAKELGVPVVMLAQLSRAVEGRGGSKEPMLSDLRESGAIEQDADVVMFPHRPQYYTDREYADVTLPNGKVMHDAPLRGLGKLFVAKQRDGATGMVMFNYNGSVSRFWDFEYNPDGSYIATPPPTLETAGPATIKNVPF